MAALGVDQKKQRKAQIMGNFYSITHLRCNRGGDCILTMKEEKRLDKSGELFDCFLSVRTEHWNSKKVLARVFMCIHACAGLSNEELTEGIVSKKSARESIQDVLP
jgi:hypothetical protein